MEKNLKEMLSEVLEKTAVKNANSASLFCFYEPEIPEKLKEAEED